MLCRPRWVVADMAASGVGAGGSGRARSALERVAGGPAVIQVLSGGVELAGVTRCSVAAGE